MYNGILVFNKPQEFTSHDVVAKLRGILRQKRIGHAGTLDPMATGVLVVLLGVATKASDDASASDKAYIAGLRPGVTTDTRDIWGAVTHTGEASVEPHELGHALEGFRGRIMQKPPMYSAVKIGGQKLYSLARRGVEIDAPAREVFIKKLEVLRREGSDFLLDIECSKGTYVRSLCHDIGQALGCGACMSSLVRTRSGDFEAGSALGFDEVERLHRAGGLDGRLLPADSVYSSLGAVTLSERGTEKVRHGALIFDEHIARGQMPGLDGERVRVYTPDGSFYMVGVARLGANRAAIACHKTFFVSE